MTYTENEYISGRNEALIATAEGNTMTETTTITPAIPYSIIDSSLALENRAMEITIVESDALILRNIIGTDLSVSDKSTVYGAGTSRGWFVKTALDAQADMTSFREAGTEAERDRIRTAAIAYTKDNGWGTSEINDLLTALGMGTMTRKFEVKVSWSAGWSYYSRPVLEFTFETDDADLNEDRIADIIGENLSFDDSEINVDMDFTLSTRIGGTDLEKFGSVEYTLDISDLYENFSVEVTEV
jgi:hypothetical protein